MIIFDVDDTLIDHTGAESAAAGLFGAQFANSIPRYQKASFAEMWRDCAERHIAAFLSGEISFQEQRRRRIRDVFRREAMSADEADRIFAVYLENYEKSWTAFPDVIPFLRKHCVDGIGVLSDGAQVQQEAKIRAAGLDSYVRFVVTAESSGFAKPDPRIFHLACELAGVTPSEAIYIGDNLKKDVIGASSAGLRGIWLNRKGLPAPEGVESIACLADYVPAAGVNSDTSAS